MHTGVKVTHHKELWLGEDDYHMPDREPMQKMMDAVTEEVNKAGRQHESSEDEH